MTPGTLFASVRTLAEHKMLWCRIEMRSVHKIRRDPTQKRNQEQTSAELKRSTYAGLWQVLPYRIYAYVTWRFVLLV